MTKVCAALLLVLACDGATATAPRTKDAAAVGKDAGGADAGADAGAAPASGHVALTDLTPAARSRVVWVAFNDGEGPWQKVERAGQVYAFDVKQGRYGLAFVCEIPGGSISGEVVHATAAELSALTVDCGEQPAAPRNVSGKITGLGADAAVEVQAGSDAPVAYLVAQVQPPATMYRGAIPAGVYDLAAFASVAGRPTRALLRRDVDLSADSVLDLDFAQGVALAEQPLTFLGDGAAAPGLASSVGLYTARGRFQAADLSGQSPKSYLAFPKSALQPQDTQEVEVLSVAGQMPKFSLRGVIRGFREPKPMEVALPPEFTSAQISIAATSPTLRPRMTFQAYPGVLYYQLLVNQLSGAGVTGWLSIFSAGWLGTRTSYDFPDFGAASGFQTRFGLQPQGMFEQACDAVTSTRDFSRTLNADPATRDGATLTYARKSDVGPIR